MTSPAMLDELDQRIADMNDELQRLHGLRARRMLALRLVEPDIIIRRQKADRTREHSLLVNSACAALGSKLDLRIAKMQPAGEPTASGRPQHCGPPGLADICGILCMQVVAHRRLQRIGRLFCLEAKTGNARQSRVQIAMMRIVRGLGGFYAVFRTVPDAEAAYERAKMGWNE